MSLDRRDLQILKLLQKDGRISNQELADKIALSPSACLARVKKLEQQGFIEGYRTKIILEKLGPVLMAFMEVTLGNHFPEDFKKFDGFIKEIDEVVESFVVGSNFDYLLQVVVSDMTELRNLSNRILESKLGVVKLNTFPVIERNKSFSGYPLEKLARN
ncbi:Lrp/AsnC family transcriptional regulator [Aliikangiella coralliicola]|uniref:Lrp/AsnC family transcriptional regulator n=1 Tax=Aliikangiella coralliicola TaxID=2592383 RepID=A0A545UG73_9GAMM|nr:Lrp/AsnC family transcriptional regulator [Aliikangiella coralliicola]TQV88472.1 Lrp/AsnC family transcriptional regulator [Aliikangiella coralliicola]